MNQESVSRLTRDQFNYINNVLLGADTRELLDMEYPIIGILGRRGSGKNITTTAIARDFEYLGLNVFANYKLNGINYRHIDPEDLAKFPEWLKDGVVILDEVHAKLDAYDFFKTVVKDASLFATQTRKRGLIFIYVSQSWNQVNKRFRILTDYIIQCNPIRDLVKGENKFVGVECLSFDKTQGIQEHKNTFFIDAPKIFGLYDTSEIVKRYN